MFSKGSNIPLLWHNMAAKASSAPLLLILCVLLGACVKNEFRMKFELPESVNSTYRLAYYASDAGGGLQVETAVAVAAGKAEATGFTRYPTLVTVSTGYSDIPAAILYAERGDEIKLQGTDADPLTWTISGNDINKLLTGWRLENMEVIRRARDISRNSSDTAPRKALNKSVATFISANAASPAAPLLLTSYFDASIDPAEFERLSHILDEAGSWAPLAPLLSRQDVNTASAVINTPKALSLTDIRLQNHEGIADTLRLRSGKAPTLLYYWTKRDSDHSSIIDTLKNLAKFRGDSASMPIADIYLGIDSIQWANILRRDSLRHTLHAFMPRGLADTTAMSHGVRTTPWFIVSSADGKALYAGPDVTEAAKKFRSLRPKAKKAPENDKTKN